ncbi:MAG: rRNA maturation RNase YbeY [bacterium]|nr:rRNA maturation RNase YbeY [bacterium]
MLRVYVTSQTRYPVNTLDIKNRVRRALTENGITDAYLTINIVGERRMRSFGTLFLQEGKDDQTHEVLSFPANDPNTVFPKGVNFKNFNDPEDSLNLGDIAICYPEARKIAIRYKRMMDQVVGELAEHAVLHLLGKHHK